LSFALHFVWKSEPTIARLVLFILYEGAASAIAYFVLFFILYKEVPCTAASPVLSLFCNNKRPPTVPAFDDPGLICPDCAQRPS